MEKTIKLLENHARLDDYEPFLMPDKLIVNFEHKGYDLSNAFITLRNGEKIEKFKFLNHFEIFHIHKTFLQGLLPSNALYPCRKDTFRLRS